MKKFEEMTYEELKVARRERKDAFGELCAKANNREFTAEEKQQEINLRRELEQLDEAMKSVNREAEHEKAMIARREVALGAQFRELLQDVRKGKVEREILLNAPESSPTDINNIAASGAIRLTINDLIPTLHEGLGLPKGLRIVTGVEGNEIWPVSVNDVEMTEVGEVEALSDQDLDFAKITPTARRCGLTVSVSNTAIDNAAFDLLGFVQRKFEIAQREYLAKKLYSRAAWTGNHGPYKSLTKAGDIEIGPDAYKQILAAVAAFSNKGFYEGNVCLAMDAVTEAELKATPKIAGAAGGFCIENGKCCGYDYVVSHFVNTELSGSTLVPTADRYINIGYWEWFALQQHGEVRMLIEAITGAKKNVTNIVLNTNWSMTDLSTKIGNAAGTTTQAFATYKVTHPEA